MIQRARTLFHWLEDGLLVSVFVTMLVLAITQIVVRNTFDFSWSWIDPLNRIGVLWIALLGAMIGARRNNHIKIDLATQLLPPALSVPINRLVAALSSVALAMLAWHTWRLVLDEKAFGSPAFNGLPAWPFQTIMPIAFGIMAIRYFWMIFWPIVPDSEDEASAE
ncbi:TRAP transporter small permease [Salinispirillum sp. LH 10-3-1]|uniref:TRAP transporter small permease protein n=1 Tax=Salinispirillum sp. LH 10-3-1 TaxID=2952525 RepID=A0AB38YCK2_9GAMM